MSLPLAPTAIPANIRTTSTAKTTITFEWDEIPCGSRGGAISYKYTLDTTPPRSDTTTDTAITLTGLDRCTSYLFKVKASNSAGGGGEGSTTASTDNESKYQKP